MSATENTRYREAAEYATTVEAARNAAGEVTPADCLAYELKQYEAAYKTQIFSREYSTENGLERLSEEHPDYAKQLAERKEEGNRQLSRIYALHGKELADEWATEHSKTRDKRLSLACLLKESAHRLLDGYADYLLKVGRNLLSGTSISAFNVRSSGHFRPVETFASRSGNMRTRHETGRASYGAYNGSGLYADLDKALIAAGAGASELAHFNQLLAEFDEAEQATERETKTATSTAPLADYITDKCSISLCDKAAKKVGLSVGKGPDTSADLRIHALVAALKNSHSLQLASIGIADFRPVLAERYGVSTYNKKYRPQHGKGTKPSRRIEKYDDAYNSAYSFLTNHYEQERRRR